MNKISVVLLSIGVLLTSSSCWQAQTTSTEDPSAALGHRIAGTWLGAYELDVPDFPRTATIVTYHPDGTAVGTSSRMFGAGDAARWGLSSTAHIQWEATGEREVRWRLLHFIHDAEGNLTRISRTHGRIRYDADFEEGEGPFWVEILAPEDLLNPLEPNNGSAEPLFTGKGTSELKRLHVQIPGQIDPTDSPS